MLLGKNTQKLVLVLGENKTTDDCDIAIEYNDQLREANTHNSALVKSNGTAEVTLLPAPAANTARDIDEIVVHNTDTITHTFFIAIKDGSTYYYVRKLSLTTRQTAVYSPVNGWSIG